MVHVKRKLRGFKVPSLPPSTLEPTARRLSTVFEPLAESDFSVPPPEAFEDIVEVVMMAVCGDGTGVEGLIPGRLNG